MAPRKKSPMSDDHKAALAEGRTQGRAVKLYLEALESSKPKRGRKRTPDSIERRIAAIDDAFPDASPMQKLELVQEKISLEAEQASVGAEVDLSQLEAAFVAAAGPYSERKGISYAAWRTVGVAPSVLKQAGIGRGQ